MNDYPNVWIIIGVSGSGKTDVGRLLSQKLECDFLEGDRRHPHANIAKMISQKSLEDKDRLPWLLEIEDDIRRAVGRNREIVITCSALKASYRKQLTALGRVKLVWLDVPESVLEKRLKERPKHYMKSEMLARQIAAFESICPKENVITVDGNLSIDGVVRELMVNIIQEFPDIEQPWWERCVE